MIHAPNPNDVPSRTLPEALPPTGITRVVPPPPIRHGGLGERSTSEGASLRGRSISGGSNLDKAAMVRLEEAFGQATLPRPTSIALEQRDKVSSALDSVVKVLVTFQDPDYSSPWMSKEVQSSTGSGVVIQTDSGLRILSAAHVVANQTFLQVQRTGVDDPEKYVAKVYAVCHDCDLALLSVDSEAFWKNLEPIKLASNPPLRSLVLVAGFPVGGHEISVSEGVVSRIESQRYSHSGRNLLAATVDAAINPGNSGGPAFNEEGELIGIAFQSMTGADMGNGFQISIQAVGHIILPSVIEKFLEGVSRFGPGDYQGFPDAGLVLQPLTNPHLRKLYRLADDVSGVRIAAVRRSGSCHGVLEENDIITRISDKQVANNGTIALDGRYGRINMLTEFTMYQCGDKVALEIIRQRTPQTVEITMGPAKYIAPKEYDKDPQYFIWCGLVFQPLTVDFLQGQDEQSPYLIDLAQTDSLVKEERQVVVVSRTLSDSVNVGYEELTQARIRSVNGEKVTDLQDFVDKIEKCSESLVEIELWRGQLVVLPGPSHPDAATANERILKHYRIANDRSLD